jgi:hypothetical protein
MTHTAEPMTLDGVLEGIESLIRQCARTSIYEPIQEAHCKKLADEFERWTSVIKAELAKQREAEPVAWRPMNTAPRDGTVIVLRFGEDGESPGWFDSPAHPIKNDDGTWPDNPYGHPWAFIDKGSEIKHGEDVGAWFVNHARDTEYGPTHWRPYIHPKQRNAGEVIEEDIALACDGYNKAMRDSGYDDSQDDGLSYASPMAMKTALSAVASWDREDAERYRFLKSNHFQLWEDRATDFSFVGNCDDIDDAIDAARRENKQ